MSIDREIKDKIDRRRIKVKDIDQLKSLDDVFNEYTIENLMKLINKGVIAEIHGVVGLGKEAKVFWAESPEGKDLAVKIFYTTTTQFIKGRYRYISDDPRFRKMRISNINKLIELWCRKEFGNLKNAYEAGIRVPRPIAFYKNILVMEFINYYDEHGVPAPLIKDEPPEDPEKAYLTIINYIERGFILGKIVHADLSEYNIVNTGKELVVIDWGSAVKSTHPEAVNLLHRDIKNINRYFKSELDVEVYDEDELVKVIIMRAEKFKETEKMCEKEGFLVIDGKTIIEELER